MSTSYPFFSIAKERNVPYAKILDIREHLQNNSSLEFWLGYRQPVSFDKDPQGAIYALVARAEQAERSRQQQVITQTA